jgi:acyl dehydratase
MFIRGLGGFGFKGNGKTSNIPDAPKRVPDYVFKDRTYPSQAFVYRLSDDDNILHIDPEVAKKAGFPRPIIHGINIMS